MTVTLTFHGAAGTVTGSHYRVEAPMARVAVDCGMFQGPKTLKRMALLKDRRRVLEKR